MSKISRREALALSSSLVTSPFLAAAARASEGAHVVIVGGGFGGAAAARTLRRISPEVRVTLITDVKEFSTCPFSNLVIASERPLESITFGYDKIAASGVDVIVGRVVALDPVGKSLTLEDGQTLTYDRAILSPGVSLKYGDVPGYSEAASTAMPHAWKAGQQTLLLRDQLAAMRQGGTVLMSVPNNPYRCPPGPYERASLMAHYLKKNNPTAKIIIIDGKDTFSKQALFTEAWESLYPGMIDHVPFADNGGVLGVDPDAMTIATAFENFEGDVVNIIPPQRAPDFVLEAGLGGGGEWCSIDQFTFESVEAPGVHVIGDAAIVGDMPKSGFSASVQGGVCAHVVAALLSGQTPDRGVLLNTCYSFVSTNYGISVAGVYRINEEGRLKSVAGTGGTSPTGAPLSIREAEANHAQSWYKNLTSFLFG
jgi:sulfide dehydrogenase [flavocytochrome c] flavoprotein subunit